MTQYEFACKLASTMNCSKAEAQRLLQEVGAMIAVSLVDDGIVPIPYVGRLKTHVRPARTGSHPRTQRKIKIPSKKVVRMVISAEMSKLLNP